MVGPAPVALLVHVDWLVIANLHQIYSSWEFGRIYGSYEREFLEADVQTDFTLPTLCLSGPGEMVNELVQVYAIGNDICAISNTTVGTFKGQAVTIYVRDPETWPAPCLLIR